MILYGYQCRECGQAYDSEFRGNVLPDTVCACGNDEIKRKYSVAVHRPMPTHFNTSVGKEIGSERQFRDELKRKGELESLRTGVDNDYQPVDPSVAREAVEKSGHMGLEATNRRRVENGQRPIRV